jgi:DNA uptake protein ComE-like DNA-binding protein
VGQGRNVDLNNAAADELEELPMICPARARALIDARPLKSWQEVALIPGFDMPMVGDLRRRGATLGGEG